MNAAAYAQQLADLMPRGRAWPADPDSKLRALLDGLAGELARVDARSDDVIREVLPLTTHELLPDWERVLGLPDSCSAIAETVDERRAVLLARLMATGGQSRRYFLELIAALGETNASITEYRPSNCEMDCESPIVDGAWRHYWRVNLPDKSNPKVVVRVGARVGARVDAFQHTIVECQIGRLKPAHTLVEFAYKEWKK